MKKLLSILLCITLMVTLFTGCKGNKGNIDNEKVKNATSEKATVTEEKEALLEYSVLTVFDEAPSLGHDNPNDVVTPAIEEKFNIRVSDVMFSAGMSSMERINMLVAADAVPDVVFVDNPNVAEFYNTGAFADLTPYKELMDTTDVYISDAGWNVLTVDDKLVALPANMSGGEIDVKNPAIADFVANDPYYTRPQNWALVVNEDILEQAGYTFKTTETLQTELDQNPRNITYDDVKMEPEIKTVEDLEELLYKVQSLDLTVDGKPVIPLSLPDWAAYHLSILKAPTPGWYANPDTLEVTGYLFNPGMKDFYKTWKKWYDDEIVDPDYIIHKGEQYQAKAASGRVAVMFPGFDVNAVRQNLKENGSDLKVIPWPTDTKGHSIDASRPAGFNNIMINKDMAEEDIIRLLEYFDWFQTEEAKDLCSWGPESAGLWEVKDGVKVLKDQVFADAYLESKKTDDGRDAEYYGIMGRDNSPYSKANLCAPGILYNEKAINRSYPLKMDAYASSYIYVSTEMLNRDGTALGNVGEISGVSGSYYWSVVKSTKIAQLLSVESDQEFDAIWEELLTSFKEEGDYEAGVEEMRPAFKKALGK